MKNVLLSLFLFGAAAASLPAFAQDEVRVAEFPGSVALADSLTGSQHVFMREVKFSDGTVCVVAEGGNGQAPAALSCDFKNRH